MNCRALLTLHCRALTTLIVVLLCAPALPAQPRHAPAQPALRTWETPYYIIHSDLDEMTIREVAVRMSRMAEEYSRRTREFSGRIQQRLPFYLFRHEADYLAAGGIPGSAGGFSGDRLMAFADRRAAAQMWNTIQHEGFHQFAHAVIGGDLPIWVNEGLAEYFGEAIFTGDGYVSGIIPPWRLQRVKQAIQSNAFMPVDQMMRLSHAEWNAGLAVINYDQAWAMVHFLAHAEDGRYQPAFNGFMRDIGRGRPWVNAWRDNFGTAYGFEQRWRDWWMSLPDSPTSDRYREAKLATLTSFLARATSQRQAFESFEQFLDAARGGSVRVPEDNWLPASLLRKAAEAIDAPGQWSLESGDGRPPQIVLRLEDESRLVGRFELRGGRIGSVLVEHDALPPLILRARELIEQGDRREARVLLQSALRAHPRSGSAPEARRLLQEIR